MNKCKLKHNFGKFKLRIKYILFLFIFLLLACGWDGCGIGPQYNSTFQITYSRDKNGKAIFYFIPPEKFILSKITSESPAINFSNTIEFKYPYLICDKSQRHIINEFSNVQIGQVWEFEFFGPASGGELISSVMITIC